jgi:hypothetical protein
MHDILEPAPGRPHPRPVNGPPNSDRGREKLDELETPLRIAYADIVDALGAEVARSIVVACEEAIDGPTRLARTGSS